MPYLYARSSDFIEPKFGMVTFLVPANVPILFSSNSEVSLSTIYAVTLNFLGVLTYQTFTSEMLAFFS